MSDDDYSKEGVIRILMKRDSMSRESAEDTVEITIEELMEAMEEEGDHETLSDILMDNLGLEPDYLLGLMGLE